MMIRRAGLATAFFLGVASLFLLSGCDSASDYETFVANLEGGQENPPVSTGGSGQAVLLVSRNGSRVDVSVAFRNLSAPLRFSHIHRAARGTNGPIIYNLWLTAAEGPFDENNPIGRTFNFSAADLADLRAGNLYVNIHSTAFPSGELRGQLLPE